MKPRLNSFKILSALTLLALVLGCASTPAPQRTQTESLLWAAGLKTVVASTDKQLQQLPTLPAGQVTVVTQTGKNYFVYPNLAANQIYVGTQKEISGLAETASAKQAAQR